jgi:cytidine deaminase
LSDSDPPESASNWPDVERRESGRRREDRDPALAPRPRSHEVPRHNPVDRRSGRERRDDAAWAAVPLESGDDPEASSEQTLVEAAREARLRAHARYSGFQVGAALETADGHVIAGCNIENASYGLTLCAERVALVKALSDGHGVFTRIVVVADTDSPTPPCGPCRQLLWEYCGDIEVILANLTTIGGRHRLSVLLPLPFDGRLLE